MDSTQRIVMRAPLEELWNASGPVDATRGHMLSAEDVTALLRGGNVRFVIAELGAPPRWISLPELFELWKRELKPRLVSPAAATTGFFLGDFPDQYAYVAIEWRQSGSEAPIVVFERHH